MHTPNMKRKGFPKPKVLSALKYSLHGVIYLLHVPLNETTDFGEDGSNTTRHLCLLNRDPYHGNVTEASDMSGL